MQITQGFIPVAADGRPLCLYKHNKGGTDIALWYYSDSLETATVVAHPELRMVYGRLQVPDDLPPFSFVPVEVRREVRLQGYGVPTKELPSSA